MDLFQVEKWITNLEKALSNQQPKNENNKETGAIYKWLRKYLIKMNNLTLTSVYIITEHNKNLIIASMNQQWNEATTQIKDVMTGTYV